MPKYYTESQKQEWADAHFPSVNKKADDVELEQYLRDVCLNGARHIDKLANGTRISLTRIKKPSRYLTYFLNGAKLDRLGKEAFVQIASRGGIEYTNEYQYATVLSDYIDTDVLKESVALIKKYTKSLPNT